MFVSLLITAGMFLSVAHSHFDDGLPVDGFEYQISQNIAECAVCTSHFKFSSDITLQSDAFLISEVTFFPNTSTRADAPPCNLPEGRAPPVSA